MQFNHYLYVLAFTDDVVKVGRTGNLKQRIKVHKRDGRDRGARAVDAFISTGLTYEQSCSEEAKLVRFCRERWPVAFGTEYFRGADVDQVINFAFDLDDEVRIARGLRPSIA